MKDIIPNFEDMSDEEFDEWFMEASKLYVESIIKEIESDPEYANAPGLSKEAYDNLMRRVMEMENSK